MNRQPYQVKYKIQWKITIFESLKRIHLVVSFSVIVYIGAMVLNSFRVVYS